MVLRKNIGAGGDYDEPDQVSWSPQLRFKTDRLDLNARWAHVEDDGAPRVQVALSDRDRTEPFVTPYRGRRERERTPGISTRASCRPSLPVALTEGRAGNAAALRTSSMSIAQVFPTARATRRSSTQISTSLSRTRYATTTAGQMSCNESHVTSRRHHQSGKRD